MVAEYPGLPAASRGVHFPRTQPVAVVVVGVRVPYYIRCRQQVAARKHQRDSGALLQWKIAQHPVAATGIRPHQVVGMVGRRLRLMAVDRADQRNPDRQRIVHPETRMVALVGAVFVDSWEYQPGRLAVEPYRTADSVPASGH